MNEIGYIRPDTDELLGECTGRIITLYLDTAFRLEPLTGSGNPSAPTHHIMGRSINGSVIKIGAAWIKTVRVGDNAGESFFSLTFDDPGLPAAINVAAFRNATDGGFTIQWRRRRG